jgi:hypothetical protein
MNSRFALLLVLIGGALVLAAVAAFIIVVGQNPHAANHALFVYGS